MNSSSENLDKLKKEQEKLRNTIESIKLDLRQGLDAMRNEQAVQLENYEVLMELLKISETELHEINAKIYNLENSDY